MEGSPRLTLRCSRVGQRVIAGIGVIAALDGAFLLAIDEVGWALLGLGSAAFLASIWYLRRSLRIDFHEREAYVRRKGHVVSVLEYDKVRAKPSLGEVALRIGPGPRIVLGKRELQRLSAEDRNWLSERVILLGN